MTFWRDALRYVTCLKHGPVHRVIFYYHGEDPTFLEDAYVFIYRNGMVEIKHRNEHVSTHIQNVEVLWKNTQGSALKSGQALSARPLSLVKSDLTSQ